MVRYGSIPYFSSFYLLLAVVVVVVVVGLVGQDVLDEDTNNLHVWYFHIVSPSWRTCAFTFTLMRCPIVVLSIKS